jgi:hypothetical protein
MSGTGSLLIRNLRKASDYDKARINQDDLLKIAIANDNNISNARRAYRQGEVPPLTPQQQYTPDEIQADVSKNYSDAITNLLSLGMRYDEASQIVTRLGADPTNLVILNNTFPSFKVDFLKRFDVKRVTTTGFVDFFTKFREVFDETKGIADNSVLFNDKFDRIINNINDLRAILPTKDQIKGLSQSVKAQFRNAEGRNNQTLGRALADIDRMLDRLGRRLPDEAVFQRLAQLDPQAQFQQLAQLQNRFDNLPSRDQVQAMIDRADALTPADFVRLISPLADSVTAGFAETQRSLVDAVAVITDSIKSGASPAEVRQIIADTIGTLPSKAQVQQIMDEVGQSRSSSRELRVLLEDLITNVGDIGQEVRGIRAEKAPVGQGALTNQEIAQLPPLVLDADVSVGGQTWDELGMTMSRNGRDMVMYFTSQRSAPGTRSSVYNAKELVDAIDDNIALQQVVRRFTNQDWRGSRTAKETIARNFMGAVKTKQQVGITSRRPSLKPSSSSSMSESGDWTEPINVGKLFQDQARTISRSSSKEPSPKPSTTARTDRSRSASVESLERSPRGESGKGVMVMGGRKPILIKKIGRGLEPVETPSHIQFGKYLLHANNMNKSVLSVHHKGGGRVQSIPVQSMSEDLRDFIVEVLQNKKASQKLFSRLPLSEQKLFEKMSKGAGVHHTLGLKPVKSDEDEKLEDRFEVLKGEWLAGNNSHELVRELRKIVIYFMEEGRLTKSQARELLMTIN